MDSQNSLLLEGEQAEIQRFVKQAEYENKEEALTTDFSFRKFIPMPDGVLDEEKWRKNNWGVDWENIVYYDAQKQIYQFGYDESLASAIRGFLVVSKLLPQIKFTFEYYDCGEDENFALHGKTEFRDGIVISKEKARVRVSRCCHCSQILQPAKEEQSVDETNKPRD